VPNLARGIQIPAGSAPGARLGGASPLCYLARVTDGYREGTGAPLEIGGVLQEAFRSIGANAASFVGIATLVVVPATLLNLGVSVAARASQGDMVLSSDPAVQLAQLGSQLAVTLPMLLVSAFLMSAAFAVAQGAIMHGTVEHLVGRRASLGESGRAALRRFFALFGTSLIVALITSVGMMMCLVPGILAAVWLAVALPACMVERLGPIASLQRSVELTEGNRGTIFVVLLILGVSVVGLSMCIVGPFTLFSMQGLTPGELPDPLSPAQLIMQVLNMGVSVVWIVVFSATNAVMYARLRGLRDGVDAQSMAQVFA
jgi:hypothetical protein